MSDLLPDVEMPENVSEELIDCPEPSEDAFKGDEEIIKAEIQEELDQEELPKIEPKEITPDEDIFKDAKPKLTKTGRKKRVASEAQKAHLAKMRVRAAEAKKKKKLQKQELLEQEALINAQKKITHQKKLDQAMAEIERRELKVKEIKEPEPIDTPPPAPAPTPKYNGTPPLTREDILKIQEEAIESYESKRKIKKEEKQKKLKQERLDRKTYDQVAKAIKPPNPDDMWNVCFQ